MEERENYNQPVNLLEPKPIYEEQQPPKKRGRFLLYVILLVVILFGSNCVYRRYSIAKLPTNSDAYDAVTLKPTKLGILQSVKNFIFHSNNFLEGQSDDRINILLLGMGGPGHDGPYLTDTNIIVSIKPSQNKVAMTSVPRDLGAQIPGEGLRKINHANAWGESQATGQGGEYARQVFTKTFDLDIPYYVRVDFAAFQEIIDAVGGINVNVPTTFTDASFPGPNNSYQTISFEAGPQIMYGERALQYARSRHGNNGEGSDFARSKRQQLILMALKEKLLSIGTYTNPIKIEKIWKSLSNHIATNLDFGQIMYLASVARDMQGDIKNLTLDDSPNGYLVSYTTQTAGFTLGPKTGSFNDINNAIKNIFSPIEQKPAELKISNDNNTQNTIPAQSNTSIFPSAKIEIQNGTWIVGLASRAQSKLEQAGFSVSHVGNALHRPIEKTTIYLIGKDISEEITNELKKVLTPNIISTALPEWLKAEYDDPATQENESGLKYQTDTNILIILGQDTKE